MSIDNNQHDGEGQAYNEPKIAPAFQTEVFLIMFKSNKLGGTYSEVRRSREGMERFINALDIMGYDMKNVEVYEQTKPWVPVRKTKPRKVRQDERR